MKPDKKYMATKPENTYDDNFIPLKSNSKFRCDLLTLTPFVNVNKSLFENNFNSNHLKFDFRNDETLSNTANNFNTSNTYSDLFPDETIESQLYSYHNDLADNSKNNSKNNIVTPDEILRNFDLDLDENTDLERAYCNNDINKIYLDIQEKNPTILTTLSAYGVPYPISRVIIKRLIKLSLQYCNKE